MIDAETALALVESKLDQVKAASDELSATLNKVEHLDLNEEQQDRLMLMIIKFGRHLSAQMPKE